MHLKGLRVAEFVYAGHMLMYVPDAAGRLQLFRAVAGEPYLAGYAGTNMDAGTRADFDSDNNVWLPVETKSK